MMLVLQESIDVGSGSYKMCLSIAFTDSTKVLEQDYKFSTKFCLHRSTHQFIAWCMNDDITTSKMEFIACS